MSAERARLRCIDWRPFRIPFVPEAAGFATARGPTAYREGLIVRVWIDDLIGVGEASPLPSFDGGSLGAARAALEEFAPRLIGTRLRDVELDDAGVEMPMPRELVAGSARSPGRAAVFALETALLDALGQVRGVPLARLLAARGREIAPAVPVNATIGGLLPDAAGVAAAGAVAAGFTCLKVKVGVGGLEADLARVRAVRDAIGSNAALRVDANGAWDVAGAVAAVRALEPLGLELVEQPVPADDVFGLARVRRAVGAPIAADEGVLDPERARAIVAAAAADVLVVKPMAVGGFAVARDILALARSAGLGAIVTSTIDTGIGVAAALHLAATLERPPHCGLATAALLATDLLRPPLPIADGRMPVPAAGGLGVSLDPTLLERHATTPATTVSARSPR